MTSKLHDRIRISDFEHKYIPRKTAEHKADEWTMAFPP